MKRFLLAIGLLALLSACGVDAPAQQDILVGGSGPVRDVARNATWVGAGVGTVNNNYIFTPNQTNEGLCLYVQNNDSSQHTFSILVYASGDQTNTAYQGNTGHWNLVGPSTTTLGLVQPSVTISAYTQVQGSARLAIVFSGGSGTGTANLYIVEGANLNQCNNVLNWTGPPCSQTMDISVAGSTTTQVLTPITGRGFYVCTFGYSAAAALAAGNITLVNGTGATCTGTPINGFVYLTATTSPLSTFWVGSPYLTTRFVGIGAPADTAGDGLCVANNQTTTIQVHLVVTQL